MLIHSCCFTVNIIVFQNARRTSKSKMADYSFPSQSSEVRLCNGFCVSSTARPNSNVASPVERIEKTRYIDMIEFGPKLPNIIFGSLDNRDEAWERGYVICSIRFDGPHIVLFPWTADFTSFQEIRKLYKLLQVSRI